MEFSGNIISWNIWAACKCIQMIFLNYPIWEHIVIIVDSFVLKALCKLSRYQFALSGVICSFQFFPVQFGAGGAKLLHLV